MTDVICIDAESRHVLQPPIPPSVLRFMATYVVVGEDLLYPCCYCGEQCRKIRLAHRPTSEWCARRFVRPAPPRTETNIVHVSVALRRPEPIS